MLRRVVVMGLAVALFAVGMAPMSEAVVDTSSSLGIMDGAILNMVASQVSEVGSAGFAASVDPMSGGLRPLGEDLRLSGVASHDLVVRRCGRPGELEWSESGQDHTFTRSDGVWPADFGGGWFLAPLGGVFHRYGGTDDTGQADAASGHLVYLTPDCGEVVLYRRESTRDCFAYRPVNCVSKRDDSDGSVEAFETYASASGYTAKEMTTTELDNGRWVKERRIRFTGPNGSVVSCYAKASSPEGQETPLPFYSVCDRFTDRFGNTIRAGYDDRGWDTFTAADGKYATLGGPCLKWVKDTRKRLVRFSCDDDGNITKMWVDGEAYGDERDGDTDGTPDPEDLAVSYEFDAESCDADASVKCLSRVEYGDGSKGWDFTYGPKPEDGSSPTDEGASQHQLVSATSPMGVTTTFGYGWAEVETYNPSNASGFIPDSNEKCALGTDLPQTRTISVVTSQTVTAPGAPTRATEWRYGLDDIPAEDEESLGAWSSPGYPAAVRQSIDPAGNRTSALYYAGPVKPCDDSGTKARNKALSEVVFGAPTETIVEETVLDADGPDDDTEPEKVVVQKSSATFDYTIGRDAKAAEPYRFGVDVGPRFQPIMTRSVVTTSNVVDGRSLTVTTDQIAPEEPECWNNKDDDGDGKADWEWRLPGVEPSASELDDGDPECLGPNDASESHSGFDVGEVPRMTVTEQPSGGLPVVTQTTYEVPDTLGMLEGVTDVFARPKTTHTMVNGAAGVGTMTNYDSLGRPVETWQTEAGGTAMRMLGRQHYNSKSQVDRVDVVTEVGISGSPTGLQSTGIKEQVGFTETDAGPRRTVTTKDPLGRETIVTFDQFDRVVSVEDKTRNATTSYTYGGPFGELTSVEHPDGGVANGGAPDVTIAPAAGGNPKAAEVTIGGSGGASNTLTVNSLGEISEAVADSGEKVTHEYLAPGTDSLAARDQVKASDGTVVSTTTTDTEGRTQATYAGSETSGTPLAQYEYYADGILEKVTGVHRWAKYGRPDATTLTTTVGGYDAEGAEVKTAESTTSLTLVGSSARVASRSGLAGSDTRGGTGVSPATRVDYEYDDRFNAVKTVIPFEVGTAAVELTSQKLVTVYDGWGNATAAIEGDIGGQVTEYRVDGSVKKSTVNNSQGVAERTYVTEYDKTGRPLRVQRMEDDALVTVTEHLYDDANGTTQTTDYGNGGSNPDTTTSRVDLAGRVTETTWSTPLGSKPFTSKFRYDSVGRVDKVTYPTGLELEYGYESGRLHQIGSPTGGKLATFGYTADGRIDDVTYGDPSSPSLTDGYQRDVTGRLEKHTVSSAHAGALVDDGFAYDIAGRLTRREDRIDDHDRTYAYDTATGALRAETFSYGDGTTFFNEYEYFGATGNRACRASGVFTPASDLTEDQLSWGAHGAALADVDLYAYGPYSAGGSTGPVSGSGNHSDLAAVGHLNGSVGGTDPTYGQLGHCSTVYPAESTPTEEIAFGSPAGRQQSVIGGAVLGYTSDSRPNYLGIPEDPATADSERLDVEFGTDAAGRRTAEKVTAADGSLATTLIHRDSNGVPIAETTTDGTALQEYVWAPTGRIATRSGGAWRFTVNDHAGTPRVTTDGAGNGATYTHLDAFGVPIPKKKAEQIAGAAVTDGGPLSIDDADPLGFQSWRRGPSGYGTTLYDANNRNYDVASGRFTSPDPVVHREDQRDLNRYAHAHNNPIAETDPLGLDETGSSLTVNQTGPTSKDTSPVRDSLMGWFGAADNQIPIASMLSSIELAVARYQMRSQGYLPSDDAYRNLEAFDFTNDPSFKQGAEAGEAAGYLMMAVTGVVSAPFVAGKVAAVQVRTAIMARTLGRRAGGEFRGWVDKARTAMESTNMPKNWALGVGYMRQFPDFDTTLATWARKGEVSGFTDRTWPEPIEDLFVWLWHRTYDGGYVDAARVFMHATYQRGGRLKFRLDGVDLDKALAYRIPTDGNPATPILTYLEELGGWEEFAQHTEFTFAELQLIRHDWTLFGATDWYMGGRWLTPSEVSQLGITYVPGFR